MKTQSNGNLTTECFSVCAVRLVVVWRRFVVKENRKCIADFQVISLSSPFITTITHRPGPPHHSPSTQDSSWFLENLLLLLFRWKAGLILVYCGPELGNILKLSNSPAGSRKLLWDKKAAIIWPYIQVDSFATAQHLLVSRDPPPPPPQPSTSNVRVSWQFSLLCSRSLELVSN